MALTGSEQMLLEWLAKHLLQDSESIDELEKIVTDANTGDEKAIEKLEFLHNNNSCSILNISSWKNREDIVDVLLQSDTQYFYNQYDRCTALHIALNHKNFGIADKFIASPKFTEHFKDVDESGRTPLMIAIGQDDLVRAQTIYSKDQAALLINAKNETTTLERAQSTKNQDMINWVTPLYNKLYHKSQAKSLKSMKSTIGNHSEDPSYPILK